MDKQKILSDLRGIFKKIFKRNIQISEKTSLNEISDWDSLASVKIFVEIEKKFKIKISGSEMNEINKIKNLLDLILKKKNENKRFNS